MTAADSSLVEWNRGARRSRRALSVPQRNSNRLDGGCISLDSKYLLKDERAPEWQRCRAFVPLFKLGFHNFVQRYALGSAAGHSDVEAELDVGDSTLRRITGHQNS